MDLIDFAYAVAQDRMGVFRNEVGLEQWTHDSVRTVFSTSPTLLLYALHRFSAVESSRAGDAREGLQADSFARSSRFWSWVQNEFVSMLSTERESLAFSDVRFRKKKLRRAIGEYSKAETRKEIHRSLIRICEELGVGLKPKRLRRWIGEIGRKRWLAPLLDRSLGAGNEGRQREEAGRWSSLSGSLCLADLMRPVGHSEDRLEEFNRGLEQEKLLAMKQLAYGASHEINNPLANIATRAQTLLADEGHPERRNKLATIYEQAMRAHEMISDLMLFAHPAAAELEQVELLDVVEQVGSALRPPLRRREIECSIKNYPGIVPIEADGNKLAVAIRALVQNASESLAVGPQEGRRIQIRVWLVDRSTMAIGVDDNGCGIEPSVQRHMFDPFYSGREAGRGLGFGLSKAWTIINRLHHGDLRHVPREKGAEFQIHIPIVQPVVELPTATATATSAEPWAA